MPHPFGDKTLSRLAQQVTTHSAVNPCLWASLVISLPLFYLSTAVAGWKSVAFFIIALLPVLLFFFSYLYLLIYNPKYLRSEEYQLKAEALQLLGDKDNLLKADADDVVSITNPILPSLPPPGGETQE